MPAAGGCATPDLHVLTAQDVPGQDRGPDALPNGRADSGVAIVLEARKQLVKFLQLS